MSIEACLPFIKFHEGGEVNSAIDRGKHTIFGVSSKYFPKSKFPEFWNDPTWEKAVKYVYGPHFWSARKLKDLPDHLAVVAFDMFVNHRPIDAARAIQRAIGRPKWYRPRVWVDGDFGPSTRRRMRENPNIARILQHRMTLYRKIIAAHPDQVGNFDGWAWRTQCLSRFSLGLEAGIDVHPNGELRV